VTETLHLTPVEWWTAADPAEPLRAPSLDDEGFIHCTTGAAEMVATANPPLSRRPARLRRPDDRSRAGHEPVPRRGPGRIYPHVFGSIDRAAIVAVRPMPRAADGAFLPFES
jgi:uncharacterized protein (DUF952 family)